MVTVLGVSTLRLSHVWTRASHKGHILQFNNWRNHLTHLILAFSARRVPSAHASGSTTTTPGRAHHGRWLCVHSHGWCHTRLSRHR
jgi:hypothetical protein